MEPAADDSTDSGGSSERIAMFPLTSVLLPHMPLPLRLFESRYLTMLAELLEQDEPSFGVVLIERGWEAGGGDQRLAFGTLARLTHVIPQADNIQVVARGGRRIRVLEWLPDEPYPRARVELVPELAWAEGDADALARTEDEVRHALARAAEYAEPVWPTDIELADDPVAAAWQLAGIAPLEQLDRQRLLTASSVSGLLSTLRELVADALPGLLAPPLPTEIDEELSRMLELAQADADEADDADDDGDADDDEPDDEHDEHDEPPRR